MKKKFVLSFLLYSKSIVESWISFPSSILRYSWIISYSIFTLLLWGIVKSYSLQPFLFYTEVCGLAAALLIHLPSSSLCVATLQPTNNKCSWTNWHATHYSFIVVEVCRWPLYRNVLLMGTNCPVSTLITSCAATPPMNAAIVWSSAAPYLHLHINKTVSWTPEGNMQHYQNSFVNSCRQYAHHERSVL